MVPNVSSSNFFTGFSNIYQVLTAPNGAKFTRCQVIMSIKCRDDFITPMFVAVDLSTTGEVVITCDIGMKSKAEALLSHFGIYLAYIFGSVADGRFSVFPNQTMCIGVRQHLEQPVNFQKEGL